MVRPPRILGRPARAADVVRRDTGTGRLVGRRSTACALKCSAGGKVSPFRFYSWQTLMLKKNHRRTQTDSNHTQHRSKPTTPFASLVAAARRWCGDQDRQRGRSITRWSGKMVADVPGPACAFALIALFHIRCDCQHWPAWYRPAGGMTGVRRRLISAQELGKLPFLSELAKAALLMLRRTGRRTSP